MKIEIGKIYRMRWPLQPSRDPIRVEVLRKRRDDNQRFVVSPVDKDKKFFWADRFTMRYVTPWMLIPDSPLVLLAMEAE